MPYVLGIDAGSTKTHAAVADLYGKIYGEGRTSGANPHTTSDVDIIARLKQAAGLAKKGGKVVAKPQAVYIGMAGIDSDADKKKVARLAAEAFPSVPQTHIFVSNDIVIARRANSDQGFGACIVSGTGSNAYAVNEDSEEAFVGGMDWLLTDDGSGYMVGRAALRAAVRSEDGREISQLEKLVKEKLEVVRMGEALAKVYSPAFAKAEVASFAPLVDFAVASGDPVARAILDAAADDLVLMVVTALRRVKLDDAPCDLVLSGSMLTKSPRLRARLVSLIAQSHPLLTAITAEREPVVGAIRLALESAFIPA